MRALQLNRGAFAVVDEDAWAAVKDIRWHVWTTDGRKSYAKSSAPFIGTQYLHRMVMKAGKGEVVRHLNGNGLDCRAANMEICTHAEALRLQRLNGETTCAAALHHAANVYMRERGVK